jgi:4-hydroxy-tetrahydrodipicolinate synthase
MSVFKGAGVALSTPFNEKGVNYDTFESLIEYQIDGGIDCLLACGTTGEPSTMSWQERIDVAKFVVKKANGRVPVMVGTGGNSTDNVIKATKAATDLGADSILLVTPYYNKCTQTGLIKHYEIVAKSTHLPIVLYNVPSRTGVNIMPETVRTLADVDNIVAIKEASGDIGQIAKTASLCQGKIDIYSGNDDQVLPILSFGGVGVISVLANVAPKAMHDMVMAYLNGDTKTATDMQLKSIPLISALFKEVNPIPVKQALNLLGFDMGEPRLPLCVPSEQTVKLLKKELTAYGFDIMEDVGL